MEFRTSKIILVCCIAAYAGLSGCKLPQSKTNKAEAAAPKVKINVSAGKAERRTLVQERKILGALQAYREADCGPLSPGRVKSLPVQIGDYVKAGQVVARMDDAQLAANEAQFASIKSQYDRSSSLYEHSALPKAQYEGVEAQYISAKRQLEALKENTTIIAPFSGIITARACEEGELYSPSMGGMPGQSKSLVRITQLDPLKLDLDVDDQTIAHIKKGMQVRLTVDQHSDTTPLSGKVEWVNPQANSASQTFGVRIIVPNPGRLLRPGFFAEAHIVMEQKSDALCVPREALVDDRVFIVSDGVAIAKKVTTGWLTNDYAEIVSGVDDGATVIVKGNKALPDSAEVNVAQ
jgi:membrane fusion protein (multidrug efflux system)